MVGGPVKANRRPGCIWTLRRPFDWPFVRTGPDDTVEIIFDVDVLNAVPLTNVLSYSRKDARLLARRINQCLDATVRR
jgi:hypothetical protein